MRSSARMAPVRPISTPASAAISTLGLNPAETTTRSQATSATRSGSMALGVDAAAQLHAVFFQLLADGRGEVRVVAQQNVRRALQHGHAQAVAAQRVGGLHADVSRPDHHRAPGPLLAEEAAHALGVFEGVQREDVGLLARPRCRPYRSARRSRS